MIGSPIVTENQQPSVFICFLWKHIVGRKNARVWNIYMLDSLLSNDVISEIHIADIADIAEIADIAHIWQSPLSVSYVTFSLSAAHQGQ